ncbi:TPA: hypothetical protein ACP3ZG_001723 [Pseudomonas aeruginosa]|uniref:Uncharacterized protein n=1 Tax=Pseudomonas aeruginosa TaxID=287 RepID=A0A241XSS4_PSEAI|nr:MULTISPECIES: hypothetical protein [Pseudomonas]ELG7182227.1 hypothetical protein [Pseudomonas aeruginosa]MBH4095086.1 hypothetical protein [Pseudomonas aeruginosa]MBI6603377.1 hypothetical protein [Pseudomonas sp. S4_EA_1b]MBI8852393.1 hypothetical protein [Pseudomonas aeruginosa]OBY58991.1 hypothetical protein A9513_001365 [Pseudomonas sp. AU12215]
MTKVTEAVRDAIATAQNQRSTVPELPSDWIKRAETAIKQESLPAVMDVAVELVESHAGYRATWDHWPWLDTLRDVTRVERALRNAKKILGYGEPDRAVKYFCRFAGSTEVTAKAALGLN